LRAVVVETFDKKQTERALQQATLQYGEPIESKEDNKIIYRWPTIMHKPPLFAELHIDGSGGSGDIDHYSEMIDENSIELTSERSPVGESRFAGQALRASEGEPSQSLAVCLTSVLSHSPAIARQPLL
jgi:hypothetical protein